MSDAFAVVSDCRGTASADPERVAAALDTAATLATHSLSAQADAILERIADADRDSVLLVAGEDPARAELRDVLEDAGIRTTTLSPYLGAGLDAEEATAVVAGAANARLAGLATRRTAATGSLDPTESVVVVGDPGTAADLAGSVSVTLIADGRDLSGVSLPDAVDVVPGRATALDRTPDGYALTVTGRVTEDCTRCGRCLRSAPDATTSVPIQVTADDPIEGVCPLDAIRPADDPVQRTLAVDQVVWPDYDGPHAETIWVHADTEGATAAVERAARMRDRRSVTVEEATCAVGTSGQPGCTACEEACPNDAIAITTDVDGGVDVNPDRCVACGTCVSVCPTASIEPTRTFDVEALGEMVQAGVGPLLETRGGNGGLLSRGSAPTPVAVAFVSESIEPAAEAALAGRETPPVVPIVVPNVMSVSDAAAVYAVALGADGVLLASDPEKPVDPVADAARKANRALASAGVGERVHLTDTADPDEIAEALRGMTPADALGAVETGSVSIDSRHAMGRDAAVALVDGHGDGAGAIAAPGSGAVAVDADACTLCNTCDNLCPTDALVQGEGRLDLDPAACVGCGLCEAACPEDAIDVDEAIRIEAGSLDGGGTVVEKEMVECSVCGEPFASRAGLEAMRDQLDEQALAAVDLEVCPSCRTSGGSRGDVRIPR
ncbi:MAG: 4Fe-4S binding protein [Halanaeroarchaeum sp.]